MNNGGDTIIFDQLLVEDVIIPDRKVDNPAVYIFTFIPEFHFNTFVLILQLYEPTKHTNALFLIQKTAKKHLKLFRVFRGHKSYSAWLLNFLSNHTVFLFLTPGDALSTELHLC